MKAISLSIKTIIPALIAGGIMLQGCGGSVESASKKDSAISFERLSIEKTYSLEGSATDFDVDSDLTVGCKASILLPSAFLGQDISSFRDSIISTALDTVVPGPAEAIERYFTDQCENMGYTPAPLHTSDATADSLAAATASLNDYDGFVGITGEIISMTSDYVSYGLTLSSYYPRAAHGMYATYYINYSAKAAKVVTLDELFTPDGLRALPAIIRSRANMMRGYIGATTIEGLPARNNFYINADGAIVFAYQPYEAASYAQGRINIPVEPYSVSEYLTPLGSKVLLPE